MTYTVTVAPRANPRVKALRWPDLDIDLSVDSIEHPTSLCLLVCVLIGVRTRWQQRARWRRGVRLRCQPAAGASKQASLA